MEGEKDVDALSNRGLLATCNSGGAGKWKREHSESIKGRSVVIIPDNDKPGWAHAAKVAADLLDANCEVRVLEVPSGKDVSEWIAAGGRVEELKALTASKAPLTVESLENLRIRWQVDSDPSEPTEEKTNRDRSPFKLDGNAVVYVDPDPDKPPVVICGRLEIVAVTCDEHGQNYGRLLRWRDTDGRTRYWSMPMALLAGDGTDCRARLLSGGLFIAPGRKARELLTMYIQTAQTDARALCVSRVGWHGNRLILPGDTDETAKFVFQSQFDEHYYNISGNVLIGVKMLAVCVPEIHA